MRGRAQAIGVAVAGILLPFFLWFGVAAAGLVVLRKGGNEAFVVLGWGLLAAFAVLLWQGDVGPIATLLATASAALMLRWTSSWPLALLAVVVVGFVAALALNIFGSAYLLQLVALLNDLLEKLRAEMPSPQVQALGQLTTVQVSGWLGFWAATSGFIAVVLARYWQAGLYNPGGFRREFQLLRLPPQMALGLVVIGVLLLMLGSEYHVWLALLGLPFVVAGIALVHGMVALKGWGRGPLVALYLAWFFLLGIVTATLFLLALVDSWLDFRGRFQARAR
ncbi:MAG TPA: hypothetical protein VLC91_01280 [Spongiibacteraceae bacterium]|nr:hypothetical protein [Spongiibacteraceae bacterium]